MRTSPHKKIEYFYKNIDIYKIYKMTTLKSRLQHKMDLKIWEKINTLYFGCCNIDITKNNKMASFGVNMEKYEYIKHNGNGNDLTFITKYNITDKDIIKLQKDNIILPVEPNECVSLTFMRTDEYTIIIKSLYIVCTREKDLTNRLICCNSKLSAKLHELSSIKDSFYTHLSVIYNIELILTEKYISKGLNVRTIEHYIKPKITAIEGEYEDDDILQYHSSKTKKVKKQKHKKTKTKIIQIEETIIIKPKNLISILPKTRQEYIKNEYIKSSIKRVIIDIHNINNTYLYTKRVYILFGFCKISFNMRQFFDIYEMKEIIRMLNNLYHSEKRFKSQIQYHQNICITHGIHYDTYTNGTVKPNSLHITGFIIDNEGIEKTPTLHFYICELNNTITSITFIKNEIQQF